MRWELLLVVLALVVLAAWLGSKYERSAAPQLGGSSAASSAPSSGASTPGTAGDIIPLRPEDYAHVGAEGVELRGLDIGEA